MKIRKKFLGKVGLLFVTLVFVVLFWRADDEHVAGTNIRVNGILGSWLRDDGGFHRSLLNVVRVLYEAKECLSTLNRWNITANFTINNVLDNLKITYNPFQSPINSFLEPRYRLTKDTVPGSETLQIIVIPHSHNDPGWKKTYREYFDDQTTKILTLMVEKLYEYPDMTFVWVESCFLDLWWQNQSEVTQQRFCELVTSGRLEITSGMWVAPDEASPHYFALVDQLIEGHYWVKKNLGVIPESSLNFDQFGYSATMPYLARKSGMKHVLIKRIHRAVKEQFGREHKMNFHWRQIWDPLGADDIFTHVGINC